MLFFSRYNKKNTSNPKFYIEIQKTSSSFEKIKWKAMGDVTQWVRHLMCKSQDLNLDGRDPHKSVLACVSIMPALGRGDRRIPRLLVKSIQPSWEAPNSERSCYKKIRWREVLQWSSGFHIQTHTYTYISPNTCTDT